MAKNILITGATAGFGRATANLFASQGWNVIITGRREERLTELQSELTEKFGVDVLTLCFDVRILADVQAAAKLLVGKWSSIDVLVNNAGLAVGRGPFQDGNIEDWERMIDTNVKGLMYVSKVISPMMIAQNYGHIINIGSIAGKEVYPDGNVYCATKHAVDALTKAMRIDLLPHNIKVTSICPGAAETEFSIVRFKGDEKKANAVYNGFDALQPEDVADTIYFCATRPAHVTINDLVIMPTAQANSTQIVKKKV